MWVCSSSRFWILLTTEATVGFAWDFHVISVLICFSAHHHHHHHQYDHIDYACMAVTFNIWFKKKGGREGGNAPYSLLHPMPLPLFIS